MNETRGCFLYFHTLTFHGTMAHDFLLHRSSNSDEIFVCCTITGEVIETIPVYEGTPKLLPTRAPDPNILVL